MKYTTEISIDLPRERVTELFADPNNLEKWQSGFRSRTLLSGISGKAGAKSRLIYDSQGSAVEMIETIIRQELPDQFLATYETTEVINDVDNYFSEEGEGKTRWVMVNVYRLGCFMFLTGIFMKGSFRKQTLEDMKNFKSFAESVG